MDIDLKIKIIQWIENTADMITGELPEFVLEVANFGFYSSLFLCICSLVVLFVFLACVKVYFDYVIDNRIDFTEDIKSFMLCIAGLIVIVFFIPVFSINSVECIKACTAPRLYAIERVMGK